MGYFRAVIFSVADFSRLGTPSTDRSTGKGKGPLDLKGDILEGMAIFDSATPNTKRARNQRKGPEVLIQMMKNSADVAPEENSYHPNGEFRGTRNIIDGPLSTESSPVGSFRQSSSHMLMYGRNRDRHPRNERLDPLHNLSYKPRATIVLFVPPDNKNHRRTSFFGIPPSIIKPPTSVLHLTLGTMAMVFAMAIQIGAFYRGPIL